MALTPARRRCYPPLAPRALTPQIDEFIQQQSQQLQKAVNDHELTIRDLEGERAARRRRAAAMVCGMGWPLTLHSLPPACLLLPHSPLLPCAAAKITRLGGDEAAALHRKDNAHEGA
jgi:hypothetical protein